MIGLVAAGSAAVVYVIARLLALQVPVEITLDTLPPGLRTRIETNALQEYLPGSASNLVEFKEQLQAHANAAISLDLEAKAALPDSEERRTLERLAAVQKNNREVFAGKRDELYQLAAYEIESTRMTPNATASWLSLGGAAIVAVVAMAGFSLTIGQGAEDVAGEQSDAPTGGLLMKTAASAQLWQRLGLAECELTAAQVPVFVLSESETEYEVQTIGIPGDACARFAFSVPRDLVTIVKMMPIEVTVTQRQ